MNYWIGFVLGIGIWDWIIFLGIPLLLFLIHRVKVGKSKGWSWGAFLLGVLWYFNFGLYVNGLIMSVVAIALYLMLGNMGLLLSIPLISLYAGFNFNADKEAHDLKEGKVILGRTKKCTDCAETVKAEARKCRFCGYQFPEGTKP